MKTINLSDMLASGITLEEFFDMTPEEHLALFEKFPGPDVEITFEGDNLALPS